MIRIYHQKVHQKHEKTGEWVNIAKFYLQKFICMLIRVEQLCKMWYHISNVYFLKNSDEASRLGGSFKIPNIYNKKYCLSL